MGVAYEMLGGNAAVRCEMTAEQLFGLKDAEHIESINEDIIFFAMDGMERDASALDKAAGDSDHSANPWVQTAILLLMAAGGSYYFVQCKKKNTAVNS